MPGGKSGDVLDWRANDPHEFISLEASSRLVNIVKGGEAAPNG